ncbi:DUF3347 domain-containing protein [Chryseobacterium sp.]|jgi:hypothetical protein|uniref:DUF3347 domain-containing protein n=1 Tax=Chryseobacterium sp. TaxID=1871047 RepID=UPI0011C81E07|nr:DUF3347 domain-containing protein [Chryseobacterium sp.]TXF74860.1 DUF3347 domain-containing protein [Chryseobacterium sp.]
MTNLKIIATVATVFIVSFTAFSCNENKSSKETTMDHTMMKSSAAATNGTQSASAKQVLADYMSIKDALVATNKEDAAKAGIAMGTALNSFDMSTYTEQQQKTLRDIIVDAKEHAEHISMSEIDHQREHFKALSKDVTDMIAITGAEAKVYQMSCPMYDGGSNWLSSSREVRNPYYGDKMIDCGKMEKELN